MIEYSLAVGDGGDDGGETGDPNLLSSLQAQAVCPRTCTTVPDK